VGSDAIWFISRGVVADEAARADLIVLSTAARFLSGFRQAGPVVWGLDLQLCHDTGRR